ncbi:hypothetical protein PTSG_06372 [Salpingoeca rosetta]|uniref:PH domain-containing protein n=1 Tax=Salpingoeca rosetta (strain ATCC 50818 / BSB-021) TaxID=946362 RepID=F2UCQ4_SALR5|nr:uncharacterized protein PTSG_06372 [Salpingoeca rosetta]EGD74361.1 hypothetical protein PTSG_06372 [Salpingoeca rosetta]|eukprot:XP_004993261.1 hypothetical protein PTSG_06372 [Salpingoeca rosetta]
MASIKEGFLVKEGRKYKTWKKRYFVLTKGDDPQLIYYSNAKKTNELSSLGMKDCVDVRAIEPPQKFHRSCHFFFEVEMSDERTLRMYTDSEDDREEWMLLIMRCMKACSQDNGPGRSGSRVFSSLYDHEPGPALVTTSPHDVCSGHLFALGRKETSWTRRWFAIRNGFMLIFDDKEVCLNADTSDMCHGGGDDGDDDQPQHHRHSPYHTPHQQQHHQQQHHQQQHPGGGGDKPALASMRAVLYRQTTMEGFDSEDDLLADDRDKEEVADGSAHQAADTR